MLNRMLAALALLTVFFLLGCASASAVGMADRSYAQNTSGYGEDEELVEDALMESEPAMESAPGAPPMASKRQEGGFGSGRRNRIAQKADPAEPTTTAAPSPAPGTPPPPPPTQPDAQVAGPLLIYTADLAMSVFETAKALDKVERLARQAGGYLVIRNDEMIRVRVPASQFDSILAKTMKLGDVLERNVEVRDVTEEYFDLQTRLHNKEAVLKRLEELLARANKVEDALKVEAELARVAGEVEQMKGRLKLLRELISFSTITVRFAPQQRETIDTQVQLPFPWLGGLGLSNLMSL